MDISKGDPEEVAAGILKELENAGATVFFEKALTSSDASGSGRVVVPKAIAEQYFPRLDAPSGIIVHAMDHMGHNYSFKFRFWINNQSRMYLLEGAGELHQRYGMSVGDMMVFAQKPDKSLVLAGRPATKSDASKKPPVKRPEKPAPAPASTAGPAPRSRDRERERDRDRDAKRSAPKATGGGSDRGQGGEASRKRKKPTTGSQYSSLLEVEPPTDGIFRPAVPSSSGAGGPPRSPGVVQTRGNKWLVSLDLAGEVYQAYFECADDANEAFAAAGGLTQQQQAQAVAGSLPAASVAEAVGA